MYVEIAGKSCLSGVTTAFG